MRIKKPSHFHHSHNKKLYQSPISSYPIPNRLVDKPYTWTEITSLCQEYGAKVELVGPSEDPTQIKLTSLDQSLTITKRSKSDDKGVKPTLSANELASIAGFMGWGIEYPVITSAPISRT